MKDFKKMVKGSRFADLKGYSLSEREDYRYSFLQGVYQLVGQLEDKTFCLDPKGYDDVPSVLKKDGAKVKCSFSINPTEYIEESPSHFEVSIRFEGDDTVHAMDESDFSADQALELFAFVFCAAEDTEYRDIDEYYGWELS